MKVVLCQKNTSCPCASAVGTRWPATAVTVPPMPSAMVRAGSAGWKCSRRHVHFDRGRHDQSDLLRAEHVPADAAVPDEATGPVWVGTKGCGLLGGSMLGPVYARQPFAV